MIVNGMKRCAMCGEWLPVDAFPRDKNRSDGLFIYCKICNSERHKRIHLERLDTVHGIPLRSDCDTCPALKLCRAEIWRPSFNPPCTPGNKFKGNKDCKILVRRGIQAQEET